MELLLLDNNTYTNFIKFIGHIHFFADNKNVTFVPIKMASEVVEFSAI